MLGIGSGSFDPETLVVLETAFDEAWITLKTNGSGNIRPNELARRICHRPRSRGASANLYRSRLEPTGCAPQIFLE